MDSIGHFFQLTNDYIEATGDIERVITSKDWLKAIPRIFQVLKDQMQDTWPSNQLKLYKPNSSSSVKDPEPVSLKDGYRFRRYTDRPTETLGEFGIGGITRKCGLIRSAFRPSDDSTTFPYLVSLVYIRYLYNTNNSDSMQNRFHRMLNYQCSSLSLVDIFNCIYALQTSKLMKTIKYKMKSG